MENLVAILPGVSFPRMREIARRKCLLGFVFRVFPTLHTAETPEPIFTQNMSNDAIPPFRG